jgi:hypothetical protein
VKDKSINGWRFDFQFSWTETWACLLALAVKKKGGRDFVLQGREEESEKDGGVSTIHTVATGRILTFLLLLGPSWQSQLATKTMFVYWKIVFFKKINFEKVFFDVW